MSDCWETFASSRAALHFYRELAPKSGRLNIQELLRLAEDAWRFKMPAMTSSG
jgi:hypothetical protein